MPQRSIGTSRTTAQGPLRSTLFILLLIPIICGFIYTWKFHVKYATDDDELDRAWAPELSSENNRKKLFRGRINAKHRNDDNASIRERRRKISAGSDEHIIESTKEQQAVSPEIVPTDSHQNDQNRVYCMIPFIWTPPALHAYYAIHASWGKRCHVLRFFIDPVIGDNDVGFYNMADPSEVLTAQKVNMTLPNDVVILHDMRRPWHTCGIEENKKNNKPVGNCRNIFEKVWRMMVYVADGSGGSCIADRDQKVGVDRAEWFVKVDSDTWLFPENVGRYAKSRDWSYNDHHYFGHVLNHRRDDRGVSIVAGGAVFYSRAALLVAADAFKHMPMDKGDEEEDGTCRDSYTGTEEVVTAVCLKKHSNIIAEPAIDSEGREEVALYELDTLLGYNRTEQGEWWFWEGKTKYPCHDNGKDCLAHLPLAFHHYKQPQYFLDFENEFYGSVIRKEEGDNTLTNHSGRIAARNWGSFDDTYQYFERIRSAMKLAEDRESASLSNANADDPRLPSSKELNNRLYCMVPFIWSPKNIPTYHAIKKTWGKRCDALKFFIDPIIGDEETGFIDVRQSISRNYTIPGDVVVLRDIKRPWNSCLDDKDERCALGMEEFGNARNIWEKIWRAWVYVDDTGDSDIAEWYVKIDSDSFLFPENLKHYVTEKGWTPEEHHYFGLILRHRINIGVTMIAGASVFFSRGTLKAAANIYRKFDNANNVSSNDSKDYDDGTWRVAPCRDVHTDQEELITAMCLKMHLGIDADPALDEAGQELISVSEIEETLLWNRTEQGEWWYWQNKPKKHPVTGKDNMHYCCGDLPLAFHGYKDSKWFFKLENEFYSEVSDEEGDSWKRYKWLGDPAVTSKYFDRVRRAMNNTKLP